MKIKRYVVREMQEAIRLIKQDLGPEAVIVSSYKVPAKGLIGLFAPRLLEVTAALDEVPEINLSVGCPPAQMAMKRGSTTERGVFSARGPVMALPAAQQADRFRGRSLYLAGNRRQKESAAASQLSSRAEKGLAAGRQTGISIVEEPAGRRGGEGDRLFEAMVNKQVQADLMGEPIQRWRKTLLNMDVQENIINHLLSVLCSECDLLGADCQQVYMSLINQVTRLLEPAYRSKKRIRILTFVGPSGVGKTTTLAKLATRFSLYEHKKIAIVAVYTYRIGAVEMLRAYGDFLGIPVEVAMTPAELSAVLERHSDKDYIFIDTAGRSARNAGQVLELKGFLDAVEEPQEVFLVLSTAAKNRDLTKTAREFQRIGYTKFIFTKLDETETHGSILNLVCAMGAPVAYLAEGQSIPDDISEACPKVLAKLLFRGVDPDEVMAT